MSCPNCHQEVPDTAKVCGNCGHPLPAAAAPPRKRGLPGWAWGLGGALLVVVLGGGLFATGVVALPGSREATSAPPAYVALAPSATRPAATSTPPTLTPSPSPTASPSPSRTSTPLRIAFVSAPNNIYDIYVMEADGQNVRHVTDNIDYDWFPSWSPDREQIAFVSGTGRNEIFVTDPDGSSRVSLTSQAGLVDEALAWTMDGARIAFSRWDGSTTRLNIYVMDTDGRNLDRLTQSEASEITPAWSPDGHRIAYARCGSEPAPGPSCDLYVMDADGGNQARLLRYDGAGDYSPDWSPDGTRIAFVSTRGGDAQIYVMGVDGSNVQRLSGNSESDHGPRWSPDGTRIIFYSWMQGGDADIYMMDADGSDVLQLTDNDWFDGYPDW